MSNRLDCVRVVLVDTSHPGNIGAAARAMLTMGLARLVLVRPRAFPHADATARASGAGAVLDAARVVGSLTEAIDDCVFSVGLTARPREFAGRVLAVRPACAEALAKYRINPGNVGFGKKRDVQFSTIVQIALRLGKPVRIGVNWGSLDQSVVAALMDENHARAEPWDAARVGRFLAEARAAARLVWHGTR